MMKWIIGGAIVLFGIYAANKFKSSQGLAATSSGAEVNLKGVSLYCSQAAPANKATSASFNPKISCYSAPLGPCENRSCGCVYDPLCSIIVNGMAG